ncbi:DUF1998 domain-containing protein [Salinactinospora qingdaonensis]|uniref:DUF1998 domain-containing protein n=1 Tax=Salinactinospora qingdaonensis TaxID=702744 RepID=A0ABP7F2A6_9ACTN
MTTPPQRVGELRTSQLLHTFGVGAIADMPNLSVTILGLDHWDPARTTVIPEPRLLAAVRRELGTQVESLRTPPYTPPNHRNVHDEWSRIGVPVALFPRWLRCTKGDCNYLGPVDAGSFQPIFSPYRPDKTRIVHNCYGQGRSRPTVVPARFVLACEKGHLDDFPWMFFVHRGSVPEPGGEQPHTLKLVETGTSGEAANVRVVCACGQGRAMSEAIGPDNAAKNLPACRGRHPHLSLFEGCDQSTRALSLGATNSWFPTQIRVFSLPREDDPLDNTLAENWSTLEPLVSLSQEQARPVLEVLPCWPQLEHHGLAKVWRAIQRRAQRSDTAGSEPELGEDDLAGPEWQAFTRDEEVHLPDFTTTRVATPRRAGAFLRRVTLVPRLREVSALYGFTRIGAPEFEVRSTEDKRIAPLASGSPTWVPCAEQRGEGIFLRFREEQVAAWERRPEVVRREKRLRDGHQRWRLARGLDSGGWPGVRYLMLHSFAHALIREFALESGYSASGIAERVYARDGDDPMAGVLLYTAASDSEGTLGGLVSLGQDPDRLDTLIEQALEAARLCSSDPLCAEQEPHDHARLYGAACHACMFAAETSCERNNHYLDRALVVDTLASGPAGTGFVQ